jgi:hypothetical protein
MAEEPGTMWLRPEEASRVALPAPLKPLLASLDTLVLTGER